MPRFDKIICAFLRPQFWPILARGVIPSLEHTSAFIDRNYRTIVDVGANKGQFATFARARWPQARLICFEPLARPRARLAAVIAGAAEIYFFALGQVEGKAQMHLASREDSSSLLPLGDTQKRLFEMQQKGLLTVPVHRLDSVLDGDTLVGPVLLKIDVQGFEYEVLMGAAGVMNQVVAVYVECSFLELYTHQKLASDVADLLGKIGFSETGRFNRCIRDGVEVQADILFERT
jgi:FkbM family methyltransferase